MAFARGKMHVSEVEPLHDGERIKLHCSYDPDNPEDTAFSKYTPSGDLELYITNPNLVGQFPVGKAFYVDLTPTEV